MAASSISSHISAGQGHVMQVLPDEVRHMCFVCVAGHVGGRYIGSGGTVVLQGKACCFLLNVAGCRL
jgi:hypothetical protein